jgi:hypothetical protein
VFLCGLVARVSVCLRPRHVNGFGRVVAEPSLFWELVEFCTGNPVLTELTIGATVSSSCSPRGSGSG